MVSEMAGRILQVIQAGKPYALESELDRAKSLLRNPPALDPLASERAELLGAIASDLHASLHLGSKASQVHLRLLQHLAENPVSLICPLFHCD